VHKEFSWEYASERILKIGIHLPKVMTKNQSGFLLKHGVKVL